MSNALLDSLLTPAVDATEPPAVQMLRIEAAKNLRRDGLPGARDEAWKYTSLRALEPRRYMRVDAQAGAQAIDPALFALAGIDGPLLVFVNGQWRRDLSQLQPIEGLTVDSLQTDDFHALQVSARTSVDDGNAFTRLNTALAVDGPVIRVAADMRVASPLRIVYIGAPAAADVAWHARAQVDIAAGGSLTLIEQHLATAANANLGNLFAQYALGVGAKLELVQLQTAVGSANLIRRSELVLDAGAELRMHTLETGAAWSRHDLNVELRGAGARVQSRGVFALRGRQHADTQLHVRHAARDTVSDILWRGLADERSRGVFRGAITVDADADGADALLSNKNLLLSAQAEIDTQPALEIYADEVKAAHGATVGQLDDRILFYLRSRGIPAAQARGMLIGAFCRAAFEALPIEALREHVDAALSAFVPEASA